MQNYDLDIVFDSTTRAIEAVATLTIAPTEEVASFNLDLVGLAVNKVEIDGDLAAFERNEAELTIWAEEALPKDSLVDVAIFYEGTPGPVPGLSG